MRYAIDRLQAEFLEMPGLRLTGKQVQRLCGVDEAICQAVLDVLVSEKFLRANPDGTYARLSDCATVAVRNGGREASRILLDV
jgi:hypothetical protein